MSIYHVSISAYFLFGCNYLPDNIFILAAVVWVLIETYFIFIQKTWHSNSPSKTVTWTYTIKYTSSPPTYLPIPQSNKKWLMCCYVMMGRRQDSTSLFHHPTPRQHIISSTDPVADMRVFLRLSKKLFLSSMYKIHIQKKYVCAFASLIMLLLLLIFKYKCLYTSLYKIYIFST